ncbi:MAG: hypothetical protein R3F62_08850 [Planctomycetota bacterium]
MNDDDAPPAPWFTIARRAPLLALLAAGTALCWAAWTLLPNRPWPLAIVRATGVVFSGVFGVATLLAACALPLELASQRYRAAGARGGHVRLLRRELMGSSWRLVAEPEGVQLEVSRGPLAPERLIGGLLLLGAGGTLLYGALASGSVVALPRSVEAFEGHALTGGLVCAGLLLLWLGSVRVELRLEGRGPLRISTRTWLSRRPHELPRAAAPLLEVTVLENGPQWALCFREAPGLLVALQRGSETEPPPDLRELAERLTRELDRVRAADPAPRGPDDT